MEYSEVLKQKQDYYGKIVGSYHMAAEKYATIKVIEENELFLKKHIMLLDKKTIVEIHQRIDELKRIIK